MPCFGAKILARASPFKGNAYGTKNSFNAQAYKARAKEVKPIRRLTKSTSKTSCLSRAYGANASY